MNSVRESRDLESAYRFLTSAEKRPYVISASVIDNTKRSNLFEASGFILESPSENILSAAGMDQGIFNSWDRNGNPLWDRIAGKKNAPFDGYEEYLFNKVGLPSPEEILARTRYRDDLARPQWNEVAVKRLDQKKNQQIKITALFISSNTSKRRVDEFRHLAPKLKVPLVKLDHAAHLGP